MSGAKAREAVRGSLLVSSPFAQVLLVESDKQSRDKVSKQLKQLTYVGKHESVDASHTQLVLRTPFAALNSAVTRDRPHRHKLQQHFGGSRGLGNTS